MRRRWLVGLALTLIVLVALGGWWLATVIRRLDHELVERLERLDYRRVEGAPAHAGEYTYRPAARELEVFLHNFAYPTTTLHGFAARLEISGDKISSITRL